MLVEVKGIFRRYFGSEGAMTVAELIEKLSAFPDKTLPVVKSPGPWEGLNEPSQIFEGYVDRDMQLQIEVPILRRCTSFLFRRN